jgi:chemotaxis protein MotA
MEADVKAMSERHKVGSKFMMSIGVFSPTFGIIGAVFGLIATMSHLDDPSKLGEGIGAAFVATFWGVFLANGIFLPVSNKLTNMTAKEVAYKRMIIEGVLSIQAGANPRMLDDLLRSNLPPKERPSGEDRQSA